MLLEFFVAKRSGKQLFSFSASIANINVGIAERMSDVVLTGLFYFIYDYLHKHFGIFDIRPSVILWVALLLCTDFTWYWYHRLAHEINLFWAAHIVHHQSEDFNYTVSARITALQAILRTGFWSILPIIGFPAEMITSILLVHGLYPFFVHTQLVGKLGILEYFMVTPSHHRVHHASNPEYLDKNYGDMFIIWDKLFGTFKKEESPVVYGLTHPLKSSSFLWQHFHFLLELGVAVKRKKGFGNKLKVLFGKPEIIDSWIRDQVEKKLNITHNEMSAGSQLNRYVVFQVVLAAILVFLFTLFENYLSWSFQLIAIIMVLITLINCGAILEQRRWIFYLEYSRLFLALTAMIIYHPTYSMITVSVILVLITLQYFTALQQKYLDWVY
jgi:sterol desaturase/sphingolipid hydroxylase (fatty acid hydroxylase superfamily)